MTLALTGSAILSFSGRCSPGEEVTVGLRPEHLIPGALGANTLSLPVSIIERTGAASIIVTDTSPEIMIAVNERVSESTHDIVVTVAPADVHLFANETGLSLLHRP